MLKLYCDSDVGSVLIGNKDWTFDVPNFGGDGVTDIFVFDNENAFDDYRREFKYISSVQGKFNIYSNDCAFEANDEDVLLTLKGRYGVYRGEHKVAFVKWEDEI